MSIVARLLVGLAACVFTAVGAALLAMASPGALGRVAGAYLLLLAIVAFLVALDERGQR